MNKQEFIDKCIRITEKVEALKTEDGFIVTDGAIDPGSYYGAEPRILWILKEASSLGRRNWKYQDYFRYTWYKHHDAMAYRRIIYTTYALLNPIKYFEDIPEWSDNNYQKAVRKLAIINIKKVPGGINTEDAVISAAYTENRELIKEQIDLYNPEVVIFGGSFRYFPWEDVPGALLENKQSLNNSAYYFTPKRLYISTSNPAYRKIQDEAYVMWIIKIYRKWKEDKHAVPNSDTI